VGIGSVAASCRSTVLSRDPLPAPAKTGAARRQGHSVRALGQRPASCDADALPGDEARLLKGQQDVGGGEFGGLPGRARTSRTRWWQRPARAGRWCYRRCRPEPSGRPALFTGTSRPPSSATVCSTTLRQNSSSRRFPARCTIITSARSRANAIATVRSMPESPGDQRAFAGQPVAAAVAVLAVVWLVVHVAGKAGCSICSAGRSVGNCEVGSVAEYWSAVAGSCGEVVRLWGSGPGVACERPGDATANEGVSQRPC